MAQPPLPSWFDRNEKSSTSEKHSLGETSCNTEALLARIKATNNMSASMMQQWFDQQMYGNHGKLTEKSNAIIERAWNYSGGQLDVAAKGSEKAIAVDEINWSKVMKAQWPLPDFFKFPIGEHVLLEEAYFYDKICTDKVISQIQSKTYMETSKIREWFKKRRELDVRQKETSKTHFTKSYVKIEKSLIYFGDRLVGPLIEKVAEFAKVPVEDVEDVLTDLKKGSPTSLEDHDQLDDTLKMVNQIKLCLPESMKFPNQEEDILEREYQKIRRKTETVCEEIHKKTKLSRREIDEWFQSRKALESRSEYMTESESEQKLRKASIFWNYNIPEDSLPKISNWAGMEIEKAREFLAKLKKDKDLVSFLRVFQGNGFRMLSDTRKYVARPTPKRYWFDPY